MRSIRWGILATGGAAAAFAEGLGETSGAELLAVGSRQESTARRFAHRFGAPRAYGSWRELASDVDVDVVYIATPPSLHRPAAEMCLSAGRAVLCEKPFTLDAREAERLVDCARERGVFLMEAMWMYVHPLVRRIADLVHDGAIGDVRVIQADFGITGPFASDHRLRDPGLGGGALLDLGVYPVSLAHCLLGPPSGVEGRAQLSLEGVDVNTGMLLSWDSGAVATLNCSLTAATPVTASVTGTAGRIDLPPGFFYPDRFTLHRAGHGPEEFTGEGPRATFRHEADEVMRCLWQNEKESQLAPLDRTVAVMRTLDLVRERIARGSARA